MNAPTPRTDALQFCVHGYPASWVIPAADARQLEQELEEAKGQLTLAREQGKRYAVDDLATALATKSQMVLDLMSERDEARATLAAMPGRAQVAAKNIATRGEAGDLSEAIILEYLEDYMRLK